LRFDTEKLSANANNKLSQERQLLKTVKLFSLIDYAVTLRLVYILRSYLIHVIYLYKGQTRIWYECNCDSTWEGDRSNTRLSHVSRSLLLSNNFPFLFSRVSCVNL